MLLSEDWFGYSVVFSVLTISSFNIFYYLQYSPPWPSFLNYIIYTVLLCDLPPLKPHCGEAPGRDSNPGRAVYRHLPLDPHTFYLYIPWKSVKGVWLSRCVGCWCDQLCPPVRSLPLPGGHRHGDILQHQQVGRYLLQQQQVGRYLLQHQQLGRYLLQYQQFRVDCNFLVKKFHVHNIKSYNQLTLKEVFKVFIKTSRLCQIMYSTHFKESA